MSSPYDLDARWAAKGEDLFWNGYQVHICETCDGGHGSDPGGDPGGARPQPPVPNVITNVATTHAAVPDSVMTTPIHRALAERELPPAEHYVDSGYPSVRLVCGALRDFGVELVSPLLADTSPQGRAGGGFDRASFDIDFDTRQARCPQGKISSSWSPCTQRDTDAIVIKFDTATCAPCPVRGQCTTAKRARRQLTVPPPELHQAQLAARSAQHSTDWQAPLRHPSRRRSHHAPSRRRDRHPSRPLPRPGQNPPPARVLRRRPQHDLTRRPVERSTARPGPHQPPHPTRPRPGRMT